jgi:hypothetical protein
MDFKFPKPEPTTVVPSLPIHKLMACTAFNEATGAGTGMANASYNASFEDKPDISVLTLARWIRAYYEDQNVKP